MHCSDSFKSVDTIWNSFPGRNLKSSAVVKSQNMLRYAYLFLKKQTCYQDFFYPCCLLFVASDNVQCLLLAAEMFN